MLGLLCISEMLLDIGKKASEQVTYHEQTITRMTVIRDIVRRYWIVVQGGTIGTIVGLLRGVAITLAPIIIDVVLDPLIESNLARSMTISSARGMSPVQ